MSGSFGLHNLSQKLDTVMLSMRGYPGVPSNRAAVAAAIPCDAPGFSNRVNGNRAVTIDFLTSLTRALRLDLLGFDYRIWLDCTTDELRNVIDRKRRFDPFQVLYDHTSPIPVFNWIVTSSSASQRAMSFREEAHAPEFRCASMAVLPGTVLQLSVRLPVRGFFKLICREEDDVFSLDQNFDLTRRRFEKDVETPVISTITIKSREVKTTIFGLAQVEPFSRDWPIDTDAKNLIKPNKCAELFQLFLRQPASDRAASIMIVLTVGQTPGLPPRMLASVSREAVRPKGS
jgi:hypothetical protein